MIGKTGRQPERVSIFGVREPLAVWALKKERERKGEWDRAGLLDV